MKVTLEKAAGQNVIRSYEPGRVAINEQEYRASVVVTPDRVLSDWPPARVSDLAAAHVQAIVALEPEVVLLGTGASLRFPAPDLTRVLVEAQIGFEVMDTGAACRTYNVLVAEGRRVAAALLLETVSEVPPP